VLVALDAHFCFFRRLRTGEDVVLDRCLNGRTGLIDPPGPRPEDGLVEPP